MWLRGGALASSLAIPLQGPPPTPSTSEQLSQQCTLNPKLPEPPETAPPTGDQVLRSVSLGGCFTVKPQQEGLFYHWFPAGEVGRQRLQDECDVIKY